MPWRTQWRKDAMTNPVENDRPGLCVCLYGVFDSLLFTRQQVPREPYLCSIYYKRRTLVLHLRPTKYDNNTILMCVPSLHININSKNATHCWRASGGSLIFCITVYMQCPTELSHYNIIVKGWSTRQPNKRGVVVGWGLRHIRALVSA